MTTMTGRERPLKQRVRLYAAGQTMYRLVTPDRGYGGYYGQQRMPARWRCIHCGRRVDGTDAEPWPYRDDPCVNNGHAPCQRQCGAVLPRLRCGCPREHRWTECPAKTEEDRMQPQHAHKGHLHRAEQS